jgi:transcriptional regulator NrdR family protein
MRKKVSKQNSKQKQIKNGTKNEKKKLLKKDKSNLNSKNVSNKQKSKKTSKTKPKKATNSTAKSKKDIVLIRSSGREENFNTDRLTQTVSRSGVSFPVARDVAKSITKKIKKTIPNSSTRSTKKKQQQSSSTSTKQRLKITSKKEPEKVLVTADQVKNLVKNELKDRNEQDHSPFSDNANTTNVGEESLTQITLNDREPVMDQVAANKNKVLFDRSKGKR